MLEPQTIAMSGAKPPNFARKTAIISATTSPMALDDSLPVLDAILVRDCTWLMRRGRGVADDACGNGGDISVLYGIVSDVFRARKNETPWARRK